MHSGPTFGDTKGGRPLREGCCARQLNVAGGSLGVVPGLLFLSFSPAWGMGPLRKGGHRSPTVAWMCQWPMGWYVCGIVLKMRFKVNAFVCLLFSNFI